MGSAQTNGLHTNLNVELGETATPEAIVDVVVKIG